MCIFTRRCSRMYILCAYGEAAVCLFLDVSSDISRAFLSVTHCLSFSRTFLGVWSSGLGRPGSSAAPLAPEPENQAQQLDPHSWTWCGGAKTLWLCCVVTVTPHGFRPVTVPVLLEFNSHLESIYYMFTVVVKREAGLQLGNIWQLHRVH